MENRTAELARAFASPAGGAGATLSPRQYELLFEMTTQLLAAQSVEEQTSLVLDTLTAELGYAGAALAIVERGRGVLRVRGAAGAADEALAGTELPLDSNAPHVRVVHDGRPAWVARDDEGAADFMRRAGFAGDLLALPLPGGHYQSERRPAADTTGAR